FLQDPSPSYTYTLSLHDALPIFYSKFPLSNDEGKRSLNGRVETVKSFLNYIRNCEEKQPNRLKSYFGSFVEYIEPNLTRDISRIDRKSTRLNSSHVKISYAVFCL